MEVMFMRLLKLLKKVLGVRYRLVFGALTLAVVAAFILPLSGQGAGGQAPAPAAQAPGGAPPARGAAPGGNGPIKVLDITKGHAFDREAYFVMLDSFGKEITWTHVENPAAQAFYDPKLAAPYDVLLFYDIAGPRPPRAPAAAPGAAAPAAAAPAAKLEGPSAETRANFKALLQSGKPLVFTHHALASWVHVWPEFVETMGGACDWGNPITVRGKQYPTSLFLDDAKQHLTVVDKAHPIMQGLAGGFDISDEVYKCEYLPDTFHVLMTTDFDKSDVNFPNQYARGLRYPGAGNNAVVWVKTAENSPVVYIAAGHGPHAYENPMYRTLLMNAIRWAASPQAKAWAKANPTKIFK